MVVISRRVLSLLGVTGGQMKRTPVESSNLKSVGYEKGRELLEVEFRNGDVYRYEGVGEETHKELMEAESVGRYFAKSVARSFPYEQLMKRGEPVGGRDEG
jgi:lysyl-tRNA synthetase class 2